jgi:hypothetical protein
MFKICTTGQALLYLLCRFQTKHPLRSLGEGAHDPHPQEDGSGFDDPLESVGLGWREAVETFEGDEDLVGAGVGEAEVAEGHAGGGIGDGTGLWVVGDRLEVAHGHRDGTGMGGILALPQASRRLSSRR